LRASQITVKDFIRGLVLSDSFRRLAYDSNNNYRFAEICVQRILGRNVYSDREKLSWSTVLATKGLQGFVDALLNSEEYLNNFGDSTVPYQRRRILPQRAQGEVTFAHMARYGKDYRDKLPKPYLRALLGTGYTGPLMSPYRWEWQKNPPKVVGVIGAVITVGGAALIGYMIVAVFLGL
jgi:phycobilisome rod-core linker protein